MHFLRLALSATVLLAGLPAAQASSRPLSVVLRFEHPPASAAEASMRTEVRELLGRSLSVRFDRTIHQTVGRAVLFHMRGYCTVGAVSIQPDSNTTAPASLGSTYFNDGSVMPFGQIDCNRIRFSLGRVLRTGDPQQYQKELDVAMGRVMVHEIYHMLSGSARYSHQGIPRSALSASDLLARTAYLPDDAATAIEKPQADQRER